MNQVDNGRPTGDEVERAILAKLASLEAMPPGEWEPRDEQVEHAAEIFGPRLFGGAATPSAA